MAKCDCEIGIFYDGNEILTKNNVTEMLTMFSRSYDLLYNEEKDPNKSILPKHYIDKRKGFMYHFNYCPVCGEKINWKEIREQIKQVKI